MLIPSIDNRSFLPNPAVNSGVIYYVTLENIYLKSDGKSWNVIDSNSITQDIGIDQPLTDEQLRASPVDVTISNPIPVDVNSDEIELGQYNQIDMLNLIYEELQQINKTLKKIYQ